MKLEKNSETFSDFPGAGSDSVEMSSDNEAVCEYCADFHQFLVLGECHLLACFLVKPLYVELEL